MSVLDALPQCDGTDITPTDRLVLLLVDYFTKVGGASRRPTRQELATMAGVSVPTLKRSIRRLEQHQILKRIRCYDSRGAAEASLLVIAKPTEKTPEA